MTSRFRLGQRARVKHGAPSWVIRAISDDGAVLYGAPCADSGCPCGGAVAGVRCAYGRIAQFCEVAGCGKK